MFLKTSNVQPGLQHLLLFQKDLQHYKEKLCHTVADFLRQQDMVRCTHRVRNIIGYSFAKHRGGESGVDILGIQVLILAVEHQRGCFAAQQVGECTPHHGETEHRAVLWVDSRG